MSEIGLKIANLISQIGKNFVVNILSRKTLSLFADELIIESITIGFEKVWKWKKSHDRSQVREKNFFFLNYKIPSITVWQ